MVIVSMNGEVQVVYVVVFLFSYFKFEGLTIYKTLLIYIYVLHLLVWIINCTRCMVYTLKLSYAHYINNIFVKVQDLKPLKQQWTFSFYFWDQPDDGHILAETCIWLCLINKSCDWNEYSILLVILSTQRRWITLRLKTNWQYQLNVKVKQ
jgi:hypothetical protein